MRSNCLNQRLYGTLLICLCDLDWFDVLDEDNLPVLTEREVLRNLQAIVTDADTIDQSQVRNSDVTHSEPHHPRYKLTLSIPSIGCTRCDRSPVN